MSIIAQLKRGNPRILRRGVSRLRARAGVRAENHPRIADATGFAIDVGRGMRDDRVSGLAAEVAFFGLLSLVPGLVALGAALTLVASASGGGFASDTEESIVNWVERALTEDASTVTAAVRELFERSNSDVFTIALVIALWSGSRGIDAVVRAVVLVTNDVERRPWWKRRLLSLGLLLGTTAASAVIVSMLVVGPMLGGGHAVADALGFGPAFAIAWTWLRLPFVAVCLGGWSLVVLHTARAAAGPWRGDLPGAAATTAMWIIASVGLWGYLRTIGASNPALGALGGVAIVLVWLYLLALSLLVGAEVGQRARERSRHANGPDLVR